MDNAVFGLSPQTEMVLWFIAAGFAGAAMLALIWALAKRFRKEDFRVGEDFGHERANVIEWNGKSGYVEAGGELWQATSTEPLAPGDPVTVTRADGLTLEVKKRQPSV